MRFLKDAYLNIVKDKIGEVPTVQDFIKIFDKISLKDPNFNHDNFKPGGSGRSELYKKLKFDSKI